MCLVVLHAHLSKEDVYKVFSSCEKSRHWQSCCLHSLALLLKGAT